MGKKAPSWRPKTDDTGSSEPTRPPLWKDEDVRKAEESTSAPSSEPTNETMYGRDTLLHVRREKVINDDCGWVAEGLECGCTQAIGSEVEIHSRAFRLLKAVISGPTGKVWMALQLPVEQPAKPSKSQDTTPKVIASTPQEAAKPAPIEAKSDEKEQDASPKWPLEPANGTRNWRALELSKELLNAPRNAPEELLNAFRVKYDTPSPMSSASPTHMETAMQLMQMQQMANQFATAQQAYLHSMNGAGTVPLQAGAAAGYTSIMLRNIPNRYGRDMLVQQLDTKFKNQYDFVYLPIDFNSKCNVGYAFINFRTPQACRLFIQDYNGVKAKHCLPGFSSVKVCEVTYARVQGRDANMDNLCDDKFIDKLIERPDWQPLFIDNKGKEVPFAKTYAFAKASRKKGVTLRSPPMAHPGMSMFPYGAMIPPHMMGMGMGMGTYGMPGPTAHVQAQNYIYLPMLLNSYSHNTMVMLKNVPGKYSRQLFRSSIEEKDTFVGKFDFLFLPSDQRGEGNRGIAFVNFRNPKKAQQFVKRYSGAKATEVFPMFPSPSTKCIEATMNCLHSVEKQLERFYHSSQKDSPEASPTWQPLLMDDQGFRLEKFLSYHHGSSTSGAQAMSEFGGQMQYGGFSQIAHEAVKASEVASMASMCAQRALADSQYTGMDGGYDEFYGAVDAGDMSATIAATGNGWQDYNSYAQDYGAQWSGY